MISSGPMLSEIRVEPRRSENHNTALMRSVTPRAMRPPQHLRRGVAAEIDPAERAARYRSAAPT